MGVPGEQESDSPPRRVWTSTLWMMGGRLWGSACTALVLWLVSQGLSGEDFGLLTFYLAVFSVLDAVVDLGSAQALVQTTSRTPDLLLPSLRAARRLRVGTSLLAGGGLSLWVTLTGERDAGWIALATLYPMTHALELSTVGLRNAIVWRPQVLVRAAASTASLLAVAWLQGRGTTSPGPFLVAVASGSTLGNVLAHLVGRRFLPHPPDSRQAPLELTRFLRAALPLGLAALAQQLYFWVDNLFVRAWHGDEAVGRYNLAVRLLSWTLTGAVFASAGALPWLARRHEAGALRPAALRLAWPLALFGALVAGALHPLSPWICSWFGPQFESSAPLLQVLLLATIAVHLGAPLLTALTGEGSHRLVLLLCGTGLALNTLLNSLWVPGEGARGAAWATVWTEAWIALGGTAALLRGARPSVALLRWLGIPLAYGLARTLVTGLL